MIYILDSSSHKANVRLQNTSENYKTTIIVHFWRLTPWTTVVWKKKKKIGMNIHQNIFDPQKK